MAGLVGEGLLTAAAAGDMFASPSAEAVLAALRQVTGPAGALCLVLNYTGPCFLLKLIFTCMKSSLRMTTICGALDKLLPFASLPCWRQGRLAYFFGLFGFI